MDYLHSDLGHLDAGSTVEVALRGNAANVLLLDSINLSRYRRGIGGFNYHGGYFTQSPVHIAVPHAGHWHVVVDLGGGGRVEASINVLTHH